MKPPIIDRDMKFIRERAISDGAAIEIHRRILAMVADYKREVLAELVKSLSKPSGRFRTVTQRRNDPAQRRGDRP
jgi:hypothetical protein